MTLDTRQLTIHPPSLELSDFSNYDFSIDSFTEHTLLPHDADAPAIDAMVALLANGGTLVVEAEDGSRARIPDGFGELMREAAGLLAQGKAVALDQRNTVLTTQEAADILAISRPTLVKLLETEDIPFTTTGTHRRILLEDLLAYEHRIGVRRKRILRRMVEEGQASGAYELVNGLIDTRAEES